VAGTYTQLEAHLPERRLDSCHVFSPLQGRDHVWFIFGERQTCLVPKEISDAPIIIGHWGDEDCMVKGKDVVVPTLTPVQHDYARSVQILHAYPTRKVGA